MNPLLMKLLRNLAIVLPFLKGSVREQEVSPPATARKRPDTSTFTEDEIKYIVHKFHNKPSHLTQEDMTTILNYDLDRTKSRSVYARIYKQHKELTSNQEKSSC